MLTDQNLRIAWKAYLCELGVMRALERPSQALIAERFFRYFRWRFLQAVPVCPTFSFHSEPTQND